MSVAGVRRQLQSPCPPPPCEVPGTELCQERRLLMSRFTSLFTFVSTLTIVSQHCHNQVHSLFTFPAVSFYSWRPSQIVMSEKH